MTRHLMFLVMLSAAVGAVAATRGTIAASGASGLVVHEWGTFTSIASEDGRAVQWLPQAGPTDLPCFVERIDSGYKGGMAGTVRMETPVIYFYAPREMTLNVKVRFRQGVMTEWFPRPVAAAGRDEIMTDALKGEISWRNVTVRPGAAARFPIEREPNHYYVARRTDASPLRSGSETERFLFYRGVGRLAPPIAATLAADGSVVARHTRGDELGDIMLFENRRGTIAYEARHGAASQAIFTPLAAGDESASPQADLERMLIGHGLYPKEAKAMVESWRGSWFEKGTRLFYIVPDRTIDAMLPLRIDPQPDRVARVFVGRLEIVTPEDLRDVKDALERNDRAVLGRHGRFLQAIGKRLVSSLSPDQRAAMDRRLQSAYASWLAPAGECR